MSEKLLAGYQRFKKGYFSENRDKLRHLAEQQKPHYALITCCDARMEPALIFDTEPGDLFVIRNVANLVPPYEVGGSY
ncbi:MAG: carbonic anhydrase, partial [Pseudomonas sp.]